MNKKIFNTLRTSAFVVAAFAFCRIYVQRSPSTILRRRRRCGCGCGLWWRRPSQRRQFSAGLRLLQPSLLRRTTLWIPSGGPAGSPFGGGPPGGPYGSSSLRLSALRVPPRRPLSLVTVDLKSKVNEPAMRWLVLLNL